MIQYVSEFSFPKSPARPTVTAGARPAIHGYAKGGHVKASTPQPFSKGGSTTPFRYKDGGTIVKTPKAEGKVPQAKNSVNPGDASSPGSYSKSAPSQAGKNSAVAKSKFAAPDVKPESTGTGNKQRMAAWSDFKDGGTTSKAFNRIKNLGHYAHGGKVKASGEKSSGTAGSSKVKAPVAKVATPKKAEPTGSPAGSRVEMKSGTAKASMGGLSRGTSKAKNAAIHAKSSKAKSGALAAIAGALGQAPHQPAAPGIGMAPPGMAPGMGAPPGGAMGPRAAPPMAGGPMQAGMKTGGPVEVVHHHVMHGGR